MVKHEAKFLPGGILLRDEIRQLLFPLFQGSMPSGDESMKTEFPPGQQRDEQPFQEILSHYLKPVAEQWKARHQALLPVP
ncbi:hypothetical protein H260_16405 [Escherichia coli O157:H7 str. TW14313]|nr:hypothetical protein AKK22_10650 [Escherichia coli]EYW91385.1 hypothetical protein BX03_06895 [Escherichia coli O111:NM str. 08-4487]EYY55190.1 hypothetical protein BX81_09455 [Escherichia coli O165:H25 str. 2010C-4874]EYZ42539.1 hypothetical protein BW92_25680 [Escherichia coli O157:H7 str. 06-3745]EZA88081.1 hypothetical protein BY45_04130 [Escherichia coli O157:H7 str. F6142]EZB36845.1 hypothetical protein BY59_25050 [Escherichia coli O157:H7 str. K1420]EZD21687.1 hypothetical protein B